LICFVRSSATREPSCQLLVPGCWFSATIGLALAGAKVAVTSVLAAMVTPQVPVPLHPPPLQPANREPSAGAAVSVTAVPLG
jgi:hypothetical protein